MPYEKLEQLPDAVKEYPRRAQEIWKEAFNSAYRSGKYSEKSCYKIAWASLKRHFQVRGEGK